MRTESNLIIRVAEWESDCGRVARLARVAGREWRQVSYYLGIIGIIGIISIIGIEVSYLLCAILVIVHSLLVIALSSSTCRSLLVSNQPLFNHLFKVI